MLLGSGEVGLSRACAEVEGLGAKGTHNASTIRSPISAPNEATGDQLKWSPSKESIELSINRFKYAWA